MVSLEWWKLGLLESAGSALFSPLQARWMTCMWSSTRIYAQHICISIAACNLTTYCRSEPHFQSACFELFHLRGNDLKILRRSVGKGIQSQSRCFNPFLDSRDSPPRYPFSTLVKGSITIMVRNKFFLWPPYHKISFGALEDFCLKILQRVLASAENVSCSCAETPIIASRIAAQTLWFLSADLHFLFSPIISIGSNTQTQVKKQLLERYGYV